MFSSRQRHNAAIGIIAFGCLAVVGSVVGIIARQGPIALPLSYVRDVRLSAALASSRRIRIRRTATIDIHGAAIFGEPKHGERREVPIALRLVPQLELLIEGKSAAAPLVDSARGQFINIHNWRGRVWTKAVEAAGLGGRDLSPKALRHTAASMAIAAGADVKVVQRMLGRADASMTLNTYADLTPDRLDEVTEAVSLQRERALNTARG